MPKYYENVFGWFDFDDIYREAVQNYDNAVFCEIGSFQGRSACYMGELIKESGKNLKLVCVDLWPTHKELNDKAALGVGQGQEAEIIRALPQSLLETFCNNIDNAGCRDVVIPIRHNSSEVAALFPDEYFSFIFVDAGHSYDQVMADLKNWYPKLKTGGIMAGHDYDAQSVADAVKDFFGEDQKRLRSSFFKVK